MATALPALDSPEAPKYWMYETGGELRGAVEHYLCGHGMTMRELNLMRAYIVQWIDSPAWDLCPGDLASRNRLDRLRRLAPQIVRRGDVEAWLRDALEAGIDPL